MNENIQELDRAINEVALKWYHTPEENTAQKQKYICELAGLMVKYKKFVRFPIKDAGNEDIFDSAVSEFWVNRLYKWNPDKQAFSKFFVNQLKLSSIDMIRKIRKMQGLHRITYLDKETGEKKKRWESPESLDAPLKETSEDDCFTLLDKLPVIQDVETEYQALECTMIDFIRQETYMMEKCGNRVTSPERKRYFSMRYTDIVSKFIREEQMNPCRKHEDEMLAQLRLPFLDYTSDRICRTVREIASSRVKPYCLLVDNRPEETTPPKQTFKADVYIAYIKRVENCKVSDASLSAHKKAFEDILEEWNKTRNN